MHVMILAPHQDDDILGAGIFIQKSVQNRDQISVVYATNGDYQGRSASAKRYYESIAALRLLGVHEDRVFYMGYGDTGMGYDHSFLYTLFHMPEDQILSSVVSRRTYHPIGGHTIHRRCMGQEASYCRKNFLEDLELILDICQPDTIILPSLFDLHGDHCACWHFMNELLQGKLCRPTLLTYLIHAGNDMTWPNRKSMSFSRPPFVSETLWNLRFSYPASEMERKMKLSCIRCFQSQEPEATNGYLLSFAKREEVFLPFHKVIPP